MILVADKKRRVVLPRPAKPGDVFQCVESGERFVLVRLQQPSKLKPPVSEKPLRRGDLTGIDLDEPAFAPINDERPD